MGKHRKISATKSSTNRIALAAIAATTLSTVGVGGAAAAPAEAAPAETAETSSSSSAPQVLAIPDIKSIPNLDEQLTKAVNYAAERAQAIAAEAQRAAEAAAAEAEQAAQAKQAEIQQVASTQSQAPQSSTSSSSSNGSVAMPAQGAFTSGFGPRWGSMHSGVDIANSVGTPILAVMDGTVIDSGPASGYGNWIRIQHDNGAMSVYGHMSTLNVSVGERVTAGQQIAGMGSEGQSTGSHLHFEIHPSGNGAVDPASWFAQHGMSL